MITARALALAFMLPATALAAEFEARPHAHDGDTYVISFRSSGIDAPELKQQCEYRGECWPCGRQAKRVLQGLLGEENVSFRVTGTDRYGWPFVQAFVDGEDIHEIMLRRGWAMVYDRYVPDDLRKRYNAAQEAAVEDQAGMWRGGGRAIRPWLWRRGERLPCEQ